MKFNMNKFKEGKLGILFTTGDQYKTLMDILTRLHQIANGKEPNEESLVGYLNTYQYDRYLYCGKDYYGDDIIEFYITKSEKREVITYKEFINSYNKSGKM